MVKVKYSGNSGLDGRFNFVSIILVGEIVRETVKNISVFGKMISPYKQVNESYYKIPRLNLISIENYYE